MLEKNNKDKKEDCPLCNVSEETIKRLREAQEKGKTDKEMLKQKNGK